MGIVIARRRFCLECRVAAKRVHCSSCGSEMVYIHVSHVPKRDDDKGWRDLKFRVHYSRHMRKPTLAAVLPVPRLKTWKGLRKDVK